MTPEQKTAVIEALDKLATTADSVMELAVVKSVLSSLDPSRLHARLDFAEVCQNAGRPIVRVCLDLLASNEEEIDDWLDEHGDRSWKNTELVRLRRAKPDEWAERIVTELRAHEGNKAATARALRVSLRTMFRWMSDPAVAGKLGAI